MIPTTKASSASSENKIAEKVPIIGQSAATASDDHQQAAIATASDNHYKVFFPHCHNAQVHQWAQPTSSDGE